jgi:hypothetical protein
MRDIEMSADQEQSAARDLEALGFKRESPGPGHYRRVGTFAFRSDGYIAAYVTAGRYWLNANFIFFRKHRREWIRTKLINLGFEDGGEYAN